MFVCPELSHERNLSQMRLLPFMGMAVACQEISFDTLQQELQLGSVYVDAFVFDCNSSVCVVLWGPFAGTHNFMCFLALLHLLLVS